MNANYVAHHTTCGDT